MSTATFTGSLAGHAAAAGAPGSGANFAQAAPQHLIVAKEVNLGLVRSLEPPQEHIGLKYCPWMHVDTDDVVFDYIKGNSTGLAPARSEDSESALWQQDEFYSGRGSASVIDWALKNHYVASDVSRYREMREIIELTNGKSGAFPLTAGSITDGFAAKVARDTVQRRKRLDNRIEWLITQALSTGGIKYADGQISFDVSFGRPVGQQDVAPASGTYASDTHDPLNDILKVQEEHYAKYGVRLTRGICSTKWVNTLYKSKKWNLLVGFPVGQNGDPDDLPYLMPGFGPAAALARLEQETGIKFEITDNVIRTRARGTTTFVNTRYIPEDQVILLPGDAEIDAFDETELGFGKLLTSPHPAGNWGSGFYSWEKEYGVDPWGQDVGTGVKAFPVFPHMDLTVAMKFTLA